MATNILQKVGSEVLEQGGRGEEATGPHSPQAAHDGFWSYYQQGQTLSDWKHWEDAATAYRYANQFDTGQFWSHYHLGQVLSELRRWEEAATAYRQAIKVDPVVYWSHYHLGHALSELGRWEEAATAYRQAVEIDPELVWPYLGLGKALLELKCWEGVITTCRQAVQIDPGQIWPHYSMARALSRLKRWDESVVAYQHAIHIKNDWVLPFIDLAYAFERLEQWQEAINHYQKAMELEPENPECRERLARLLLTLDRKEEAAEAYSQLIMLSSSAELTIILGEILGHIGRADLAIPAYCRAIELDPRISLGYNRLGSTLEQLERCDDALKIYEQAVANSVGDAETLHRLESLKTRSVA